MQVNGMDCLCALGGVLEHVPDLVGPVLANSWVQKQGPYQLWAAAALGDGSGVTTLCPSLDGCLLGPPCLWHGPLDRG